MNTEEKFKKKEILYQQIEKDKPVVGVACLRGNHKLYFYSLYELKEILANNMFNDALEHMYILETQNANYNESLYKKTQRVLNQFRREPTMLIFQNHHLFEQSLKIYYDKNFDLNNLVGLTKEELNKNYEENRQMIINKLEEMGIGISKTNKNTISAIGRLTLEEGEVKVISFSF
jgi:hypothetical protein